jgi:predicted DNA-binding transcriptional regulator AlpA
MPISTNCRPIDAAAFLGLSVSTLAKMRLRGDGPRYAKIGKRVVLYALKDLEVWVEARKRNSTSEDLGRAR